jgi:hypothetical protein
MSRSLLSLLVYSFRRTGPIVFSTIRLRSLIVGPLAMAACIFCAASPRADDTVPPHGTVTPQTRLLVSTTGRVVEGHIIPHAGGYMVEMSAGSIFMPFENVRLSASSLQDAYQKLRKSMPESTATNHVSLAKWCISNKQFSAAKTELLDALEMEPTRSDARQILGRLDSLTNPQPAPPTRKRRRTDGFHAREIESLNGLSRPSGQEFVKKVLPILKNKCGNANCHGGTATKIPFRLLRTGGRDHRIYAERNLAETLKYINVQSPAGSRLFSGLAPGHGGSSRTVFHGRPGLKQTDSLRKWVYQVARERRGNDSYDHQVAATGPPAAGQTGGVIDNSNRPGIADRSVVPPSGPRKTVDANGSKPVSTRQNIVDSIREDAQHDAFDPDVFNRMNRTERRIAEIDGTQIINSAKRGF